MRPNNELQRTSEGNAAGSPLNSVLGRPGTFEQEPLLAAGVQWLRVPVEAIAAARRGYYDALRERLREHLQSGNCASWSKALRRERRRR